MAKRRNKYLGVTVPDIKKSGLDRPEEVVAIATNILQEFKDGKISKRTAVSCLNLLELIIQREKDFSDRQKKRLRSYVDECRKLLEELAEKKSKKKTRKSRSRKRRKKK